MCCFELKDLEDCFPSYPHELEICEDAPLLESG